MKYMRQSFLISGLIVASVCAQAVDASAMTSPEAREEILTHYLKVHPATKWSYDWTTAIFLYGAISSMPAKESVLPLSAINQDLVAVWKKHPAQVTTPDLAAMSLPVALLPKSAPLNRFEALTQTYFETEPLNQGGVFDHVGRRHHFEPWLPPTHWLVHSSVWADSSVMYVLNGFKLARRNGDAKAQDFFEQQLLKIHNLLWNPSAQLYKHAYFFGSNSFAPADGFWARGNLWMALAYFEVIHDLPFDDPLRPTFMAHFQTVMASLKAHADPKKGLTTLLDYESAKNPYETTASALFAHLEIRGAREGFLPSADLHSGLSLAHELARTQLSQVGPNELSVRGISCPTTAMSWPSYYTRIVGECADQSYGVGAVLLMLGDL